MDKANSALSYVQNTYDVSVTARKYLDLYRMDPTRRGVTYGLDIQYTSEERRAAA